MDDPSNENISVADNKAILATGGYDHTVKLWQAHSSVCYWTGQHADSVFLLSFFDRMLICCKFLV